MYIEQNIALHKMKTNQMNACHTLTRRSHQPEIIFFYQCIRFQSSRVYFKDFQSDFQNKVL